MALKDIVVGLDGSQTSDAALQWAHGCAVATNGSVRALSTWKMPLIAGLPSIIGGLPSQAFMANFCAEALDKSLADSGLTDEIAQDIREGDAGAILAGESAEADLVVIGRDGSGRTRHRLAELVLGSTARYCIHHAQGPIATIPHGWRWVTDPVVVVGIDGSEASIAALRWALDNLPAGATLHAVKAVPPYIDALVAFDHSALDRVLESADRELDESIVTALGDDEAALPRVEPLVVVEDPRYALLDPGFAPDLIVVGERGKGAVASRLLGSVADHAARFAPCPVVVVPTPGATP